jgi:hypothetical protein
MRNLQTSLIAAALLLAAALQPASAEDKPMERTITVSASASAAATPDEASIQTGVSSEAKTAREALAANSRAMNEVIGKLKASGIEPKDIQTSQFSIEPVHAYPQEGQPPVITGYRAHNAVAVKVRNLDKLGEVLDQLVAAGSNEMGGISFGVSKAETLKDEARQQAIANALRRAKLYAAAAGAEVGEIVQISEETSYTGPRPMMGGARMAMAAEAAPIERGSIDLEARVTATWRLK